MRSARPLLDNLASNLAYAGFMALVTLFVVPLYVHALGAAWSYVALCLTIQGFLFLLDVAIAPLMLRDVARAQVTGHGPATYQRFLRLYGGVAVLAFAVGQGLVLLAAGHGGEGIESMPPDLRLALQLALVQFLFQFSNNAAIGYWNGVQRQRHANTRLLAFAFAKHLLALLLVLQWRTATAYMLPFALVGAIEFAMNYRLLRAEHAGLPGMPARGDWRDIGGYAAATALGLATAQVDRWYLCLALPADRYGIYYLAGSLMLSMFSLQVPITRAFLPRMATARQPFAVARKMRRVLIVLIVLPSLLLAAFAPAALNLWLHDAAIASAGAASFRLMMLAAAMSALFAPTGMLLLHRHRYAAIAAIHATILALQLLVLVVLTPRLGMLAGACAWLTCGAIQLACAGYHGRFADR